MQGIFTLKKKKKRERALFKRKAGKGFKQPPCITYEKSFFLRSSQSEMTGAVSYVGGRKSPREEFDWLALVHVLVFEPMPKSLGAL